MPATTKLLIGSLVALGALGLTVRYAGLPGRGTAPARGAAPVNRLGYLSSRELPDSIALLGPPPAPGSDAMKADEAARSAALPLKGTPRYALAALEAPRSQANTVGAFLCAVGTDISTSRTPRLMELLSRVRLDIRATTYPAKAHFRRQRPFDVHGTRTCYPDDEAMTRGDGSYPSARGAVGWAYALVLADLRPDRSRLILQRGRDFGQSRIVCDQEWASDVDAGRTIAGITMGRLKANAAYNADLEAARKEVAAEVAAKVPPPANCAAEHVALASR